MKGVPPNQDILVAIVVPSYLLTARGNGQSSTIGLVLLPYTQLRLSRRPKTTGSGTASFMGSSAQKRSASLSSRVESTSDARLAFSRIGSSPQRVPASSSSTISRKIVEGVCTVVAPLGSDTSTDLRCLQLPQG
jgi:hypothetical protein